MTVDLVVSFRPWIHGICSVKDDVIIHVYHCIDEPDTYRKPSLVGRELVNGLRIQGKGLITTDSCPGRNIVGGLIYRPRW